MPSVCECEGVAAGESVAFEGSTCIRGGVGAGAVVRVAGNLTVEGVVQAATIEVEGDLVLKGGVVGQGRAIVSATGSVVATFLESATIEAGRMLRVDREAMNCQMIIHGWIDSPEGAIVGGRAQVMRSIRVKALGSESAVETVLVLGTVPLLEDRLGQLERLSKLSDEELEAAKREMERLSMPGQILKAADKERQTELTFDLDRLAKSHHRCDAVLGLGREEVNNGRTTDLTVLEWLHPSVVLESDGVSLAVDRGILGPIRIYRDARGNVLVESEPGGVPVPIKNFRDIRVRSLGLSADRK